jgi:2-polyprenyl-3-methyl-5-hydroxy-6-metoxy-1,4-benzoquinol methylase
MMQKHSSQAMWAAPGLRLLLAIAAIVSTVFLAATLLPASSRSHGDAIDRFISSASESAAQVRALSAQLEELRDETLFQQSQIRRLRALVGSVSCKVQDLGPTGGFCLSAEKGSPGANLVDQGFATILAEVFDGQSVLDVGCGLGNYGRWFKENATSVAWEGIDGAENVEEMTGGHVKFADLTEELRLPQTDWVMSFEVGEHIPKQFQDVFVDNLCKSAKRGVVMSWARPGQGGFAHVNEMSMEDVQALFVAKGMVLDEALGKRLRDSATVLWLKWNTQVFRWPDKAV